ncbi:hypothetical protein ACJQWK_08284 [Exserohilum turcicum]
MPGQPQTLIWDGSRESGPYKKLYEDAAALYEKNRMDETLEKIESNLSDPSLPSYYRMQNCILAAFATYSWSSAHPYVTSAKQEYARSHALAENLDDQGYLKALEEIREDIKTLDERRRQDFADSISLYPTAEDYDEFERSALEAQGLGLEDLLDNAGEEITCEEAGCEIPIEGQKELAHIENMAGKHAETFSIPIGPKGEATQAPTLSFFKLPEESTEQDASKQFGYQKIPTINRNGAQHTHLHTIDEEEELANPIDPPKWPLDKRIDCLLNLASSIPEGHRQ